MADVFLDTNLLLRHFLQDHPEHSPRATTYLAKTEQGDVEAYTADTVVFETVFTLERHYHQPKDTIAGLLLPVIELPGINLPGKRRLRKVFDLYVNRNIPFADAYHAVLMEHLNLDEIASFDTHFDRIPRIRRIHFSNE